jgi:hypothetical protein
MPRPILVATLAFVAVFYPSLAGYVGPVRIFMIKQDCLLRFVVTVIVAVSTLSMVAQDSPVDSGSKAPVAAAKPVADDTAALAKATQNPVTRLISVPLQFWHRALQPDERYL